MNTSRIFASKKWLVLIATVVLIAAVLAILNVEKKDRIGLVLMHGKGGTPSGPIAALADSLAGSGILVEAPLMAWGRGRIYEKTYDDAMAEIDDAVSRLKSRGAGQIFVGGHSLGANAALGFAARREGLSGVIILAYGHSPRRIEKMLPDSLAKARQMIAAGNGRESADFGDINQGRRLQRTMTAEIYVSWFQPGGPAGAGKNARAIKPSTPVLWVEDDARRKRTNARRRIFNKVPEHPKNEFRVISSTHRKVPTDAIGIVTDWLNRP